MEFSDVDPYWLGVALRKVKYFLDPIARRPLEMAADLNTWEFKALFSQNAKDVLET